MKPESNPLTVGRKVAAASFLLFVTLSLVALLSQPGASKDEWFHAASIWCGQGERETLCPEAHSGDGKVTEVRTSFSVSGCAAQPKYPLVCTFRSGDTAPTMAANDGIYPRLFYFVLSWVVVPSIELGVLLARVVNALLVSMVLGLFMWLLPPRHRIALFSILLVSLPVTGSFLWSSIHPGSWTSVGVGLGWLALHASLTCDNMLRRRQLALFAAGLIGFVMAVGSSWDSVPMLLFVFLLVGSQMVLVRTTNRKRVSLILMLLVIGTIVTAELSSGPSPFKLITSFLGFLSSEPDRLTVMTTSVLQKVPSALDSLASVPTMNTVWLPELVYVLSVLIIALQVYGGANSRSAWQKIGFGSTLVFLALLLVRQNMTFDYRAMHTIEASLTFPMLLFAMAWWQLFGPSDMFKRIASSLNLVIGLATATFLLSQYTIIERFSDRQTYGARLVPDGPDNWWWKWLPVSPTVVVFVAAGFLWIFLQKVKHILELTVNASSAK